ncbi:MAG: 16S rRNA (uracil(1498)-N(3))-methyltransferase [Vicingaceae bacterium]
MPLFYSTHIIDQTIELDAEESRHLSKVLRLTNGDKVKVVDGKGNSYDCTIIEAHKKNSQLRIDHREQHLEISGVHLAVAPTKNLNRWEWFLEKATEIGIDRISPIQSFHSERKVLKRERQEKILISAMKQSKKASLPHLGDLTPFNAWLKGHSEKTDELEKYIAHCYDELPKMKLSSIHPKGKKALILIGPEGDFSKEEVMAATAAGFRPVSLSKSRLRTETAAIVACNTIHIINA